MGEKRASLLVVDFLCVNQMQEFCMGLCMCVFDKQVGNARVCASLLQRPNCLYLSPSTRKKNHLSMTKGE